MSKRQINYDNDKQLTAQRLKEAMSDLGMTLTELADKAKVSKSSISQYTHAVQSPSNLSAMAMAKVLQVNPVWLMGFDVPKSREAYIHQQNQTKRLVVYANYAASHAFLAKVYDNLPIEGKQELRNFTEYMRIKYGLHVEELGEDYEREHNEEEK